MERRAIDQMLRKFEIELEEETRKSLIDEFLAAHHAEMSAERERADNASQTLSELQKSYDSAVRNSEDLDALKAEMASLKAKNRQDLADIEARYQAKLLDNAIELALTRAGARNNKAAAALLDKTSLKLNEDGTVFGLSEMIDTVKKDEGTSFLFNQPDPEPEERKVYNYVPKSDVEKAPVDPVQRLVETAQTTSNSQIQGW